MLTELCEFLVTPFSRWVLLFLGITVTIIQYLNTPQRFSFKTAEFGFSFKWYIFLLCMLNLFTSSLTVIGQWATIPFTNYLPDFWYIYMFILILLS